ncbi:MAG: tetratricopeptide repeat protein, partial [Planctomycetota bacterium]|nr:tetratricopeptide repeat protein [Planctomycetota bacterium]
RRLLDEAGEAYARDARPAGDGRMLQALHLLQKIDVKPRALRAYHHETLQAPLARRDTREAEKRALFWLENFPGDLYALRLLVEIRHRGGDAARIAQAAAALLEKRPGDVDIREILAIALYRAGEWRKASGEAQRVTSEDPGRVEAWRLLAEISADLGDKELGVGAARRMLRIVGYPDESAWTHARGETVLAAAVKILHRFSEYRELAPLAAFYLARHPEADWAAMAEGVARLKIGDARGAEPLLRRALAVAGNETQVAFELGLALAKQRKHAAAAAQFAALLAEDPSMERAYYQLGLALERLGDERAASLLERSRELAASERAIRRSRQLRASGQRLEAAVSRSRGYLARGQLREAEEALRHPEVRDDVGAWLHLFDLYLRCLRLRDAAGVLGRIESRLGASHGDVSGSKARLGWARGEKKRAVEMLATRLGELAVPWRLQLARWLIALGRYAEVPPILEPLRRGASSREESFLLGQAYLGAGRHSEALAMFESISRGDTRWDAWQVNVWRGRALVEAGGDPREAWRLFLETPPRRRGSDAALRARVEILSRLAAVEPREAGELAKARAARRRAAALGPRLERNRQRCASAPWPAAGPLHLDLADALHEAGDVPGAILHGRLAALADPRSPAALERLASWLDRPADAFLGLRLLRRLAALRPGDGEVARRLRRLERAWWLAAEGRGEGEGQATKDHDGG